MFTSNNTHNPFAYWNRYEHQPSSFLHFTPPFLDYDDEIFMSQELSPPQANVSSNEDASNVADEGMVVFSPLEVNLKKRKSGSKQPRKKTPKKKDRHSKIYTAQGLRDRRIRLSLQIARKFFDLQDMLGFDKASKTIEWLITKSKSAIKELDVGQNLQSQVKHTNSCNNGKSVSSASESEVMSGIVEALVDNNNKNRKSDKLLACNLLARESRDRARARARERTREKMVIRGLKISKQANEANPKVLLDSQMDCGSFAESFLGNSNGSSEEISNNGFQGFASNWDLMNNTTIHISPTTGNVQVQNPNSKFVPNSDTYQNPSSILMIIPNNQNLNPSSVFMTTSNSEEVNPICLQSHMIEHRYPCNAMRQDSQFRLNYENLF